MIFKSKIYQLFTVTSGKYLNLSESQSFICILGALTASVSQGCNVDQKEKVCKLLITLLAIVQCFILCFFSISDNTKSYSRAMY